MDLREIESVRVELSVVRAEQGDALRNADSFRDAHGSDEDASAAMRNVLRLQSRVNELERRLRELTEQ